MARTSRTPLLRSPSPPPPTLPLRIYDRAGTTLFFHEWQPQTSKKAVTSFAERAKLVQGLIWSLKSLSATIDPTSTTNKQMGTPMRIGEGCSFKSFTSDDDYTLHMMELPSGIVFALFTAVGVGDLRDVMRDLYQNLYVELVVKNPEFVVGKPFQFDAFLQGLNKRLMAVRLVG